MSDRATGNNKFNILQGKSRGFGFVTMKNPEDVELIMNEAKHVLDGKTVKKIG